MQNIIVEFGFVHVQVTACFPSLHYPEHCRKHQSVKERVPVCLPLCCRMLGLEKEYKISSGWLIVINWSGTAPAEAGFHYWSSKFEWLISALEAFSHCILTLRQPEFMLCKRFWVWGCARDYHAYKPSHHGLITTLSKVPWCTRSRVFPNMREVHLTMWCQADGRAGKGTRAAQSSEKEAGIIWM